MSALAPVLIVTFLLLPLELLLTPPLPTSFLWAPSHPKRSQYLLLTERDGGGKGKSHALLFLSELLT